MHRRFDYVMSTPGVLEQASLKAAGALADTLAERDLPARTGPTCCATPRSRSLATSQGGVILVAFVRSVQAQTQ